MFPCGRSDAVGLDGSGGGEERRHLRGVVGLGRWRPRDDLVEDVLEALVGAVRRPLVLPIPCAELAVEGGGAVARLSVVSAVRAYPLAACYTRREQRLEHRGDGWRPACTRRSGRTTSGDRGGSDRCSTGVGRIDGGDSDCGDCLDRGRSAAVGAHGADTDTAYVLDAEEDRAADVGGAVGGASRVGRGWKPNWMEEMEDGAVFSCTTAGTVAAVTCALPALFRALLLVFLLALLVLGLVAGGGVRRRAGKSCRSASSGGMALGGGGPTTGFRGWKPVEAMLVRPSTTARRIRLVTVITDCRTGGRPELRDGHRTRHHRGGEGRKKRRGMGEEQKVRCGGRGRRARQGTEGEKRKAVRGQQEKTGTRRRRSGDGSGITCGEEWGGEKGEGKRTMLRRMRVRRRWRRAV